MISNSPTSLLHLPNEILLDVCDGFDRIALLRLAGLCRHLHDLAHSILFRRQVAHLQMLVDLGNLSTYGESIEYLLECGNITAGPLVLNLEYGLALFDDLYAFVTFISRLDRLGRVEIRLSGVMPPISSGRRWPLKFAAVMNAVAEKPQSTLTVICGGCWTTEGRPFEYGINTVHSATPIARFACSHAVPPSDGQYSSPNTKILQSLIYPVFRFLEKLTTKYTYGIKSLL